MESKFLCKSVGKRISKGAKTNHMLILNLALADFLMGVYLIMLGIAGVVFDGIFCRHELDWRSGATCQAMGVLVVLSSETSVLTMVLLASIRLYVIYRVSNFSVVLYIFYSGCTYGTHCNNIRANGYH